MKKREENKNPNHLEKTGLGQTGGFELSNIEDNYQSHTDLSIPCLSQKLRIF